MNKHSIPLPLHQTASKPNKQWIRITFMATCRESGDLARCPYSEKSITKHNCSTSSSIAAIEVSKIYTTSAVIKGNLYPPQHRPDHSIAATNEDVEPSDTIYTFIYSCNCLCTRFNIHHWPIYYEHPK